MTEEKLTKKQVIKLSIYTILGTIAFVFIVLMIITKGNLFSMEGSGKYLNILLKVIIGFVIFVGLIGFSVYRSKNKRLIKNLRSRKGKRITAIIVISIGIYLILQGGIKYFTGMTGIETNIILFRVGFGIITIIWGIYNLKKNKKIKNDRRI